MLYITIRDFTADPVSRKRTWDKTAPEKKPSFFMTPAGEYFYIHGKVILEEIENLRRETVKIGQEKGRQLQIGYLKCYSGMELHQAVAEFSLRYPEVSINITHGTHEELYDLLRLGGVDLIVRPRLCNTGGFETNSLYFDLLKGTTKY